jgi:SAM-dependent methyltransferase
MDRRLVNVGCGTRYHQDWINIDIVPRGPHVITHDVSRGIPLSDASCEVVYHSAVLEHLRPADALTFTRECYRVLVPGGVIRVAVPDLERICELYLQTLRAAIDGDPAAGHDYDWMLLELYDQTTRERSGGGMVAYLQRESPPNDAFVLERIGEEGRELLALLRGTRRADGGGRQPGGLAGVAGAVRRVRAVLVSGLLRLLLGSDGVRALEIGRFRLAGEVHQWMYDRYSLAKLLLKAGFRDPIQQGAVSSRIAGWPSFNLDTLADGTVVKPDLFYMEAIKPATHDA